jgi:hypothetical protein
MRAYAEHKGNRIVGLTTVINDDAFINILLRWDGSDFKSCKTWQIEQLCD